MVRDFTGKVVSTKMHKTIVVEIKREKPHPIYKKIVRSVKRFKVHNEHTDVKVGDTVRIVATRPISKEKHFKVMEVVKGGLVAK